ncbi:MAG TPA: S41 family peptidase [Candidatus Acidoferrum sp.]|jgi:carboxyl-terminal processing protease
MMGPAQFPCHRNGVRIFAALVLLGVANLVAAGGNASQNRSAAVPPADSQRQQERLSAKDRKSVFEKVWKDIRDYYYDPAFNGVNWREVHDRYAPLVEGTKTDAEFYLLMSRMTSELHDAHTRFNSPEAWSNRKKQQRVGAGFAAGEVDGKMVITEVDANSDAARRGVLPGMIVLRVNDQPVDAQLAEIVKAATASSTERATQFYIYRRLFGGPANSAIKLGLQRADGSEFEASLTRQVFSDAPSVISRLLPSGNAYIRFDGFEHPIVKEFKEALTKFRDAPGLVIDLRKNGGGDLSVILPLAGYFFDKKTLFAKDSTRSGRPLSEFVGFFKVPLEINVGGASEQLFSGPVTILVDARSASSSEIFAAGMQDTGRAKIVGTQSCGCVLGIAKSREMKGGGVLEISEVVWFSPKGRRLEGSGVLPDETAAPTIADLQQQRDPALAEAEKALGAMGLAQRAAAQESVKGQGKAQF